MLGASHGALSGVPQRPLYSSVEVLTAMTVMTRRLKIKAGHGDVDVPIRVFWPIEGDGAWECRWEIEWPDRTRANAGRGVDAVQALLHALQMVGTEIYCSDEHRSGKLSWVSGRTGYGFPLPASGRDPFVGDDAKFL